MRELTLIEPWLEGSPRKGQTFAVIFPHSDDFSIFAGGLIEKLRYEGATGHFIRVTQDEMDSFDLSTGETVYRIERETIRVAEFWGIEKLWDLGYKNHYMDHALIVELRHRLISLFRYLKIDIAVTFDPWGHYEENPDHYITGIAVEQACWMAGRKQDLPELSVMGITPHRVLEKYYVARGPQQSNAVIDIAGVCGKKYEAICMHETPVDNMWRQHLEDCGGKTSFADKQDFIRRSFLAEQPEQQGLRLYEKYYHSV